MRRTHPCWSHHSAGVALDRPILGPTKAVLMIASRGVLQSESSARERLMSLSSCANPDRQQSRMSPPLLKCSYRYRPVVSAGAVLAEVDAQLVDTA